MRKKREKLFRFLLSRGFSPGVTGETVRELLSDHQEDEDFPEPELQTDI